MNAIRGPPNARNTKGEHSHAPPLCGGGEISRRNRFGIGWSAPVKVNAPCGCNSRPPHHSFYFNPLVVSALGACRWFA
jgi:hypothetical protein